MKLSWDKIDLSKPATAENDNLEKSIPGFIIIKALARILLYLWLVIFLGVNLIVRKSSLKFSYIETVDISSININGTIIIGIVISLAFFMLILRPVVGKRKPNATSKTPPLVQTIKSFGLLPKGLDTISAFFLGTIFLFLYFAFVWIYKDTVEFLLHFSFFYGLMCYSAMQAMFVLFNPARFINISLLFGVMLVQYLFTKEGLFFEQDTKPYAELLPVVMLFILPLLHKFNIFARLINNSSQ